MYRTPGKLTGTQQATLYYMRRRRRARAIEQALGNTPVIEGIGDIGSGLVGSWSELSGSPLAALDSSGNGYTLYPQPGVTAGTGLAEVVEDADWLKVQQQTDFAFNGTTGYFSSAEPTPAIQFGTGDFSVNCWLYPVSPWGTATTVGVVGKKAADDAPGWQLYQNSIEDIGQLGIRIGDGATNIDFFTANTVPTGKWTMATMVRAGGVMFWFLNTVANGSIAGALDISGSESNFIIGYAETWLAYFPGAMDNIGVWNRALTPLEISTLYHGSPYSS